MKPGSFVVKPGMVGPEKVIVNGIEVTELVEGVSILCQQGAAPVVRLGLKAGVEVDEVAGDGVVEVAPNGPDIADWLSRLDPTQLDKAVLDRFDMGGGSTMQVVLAVLIDWARGKG